MNEAAITELVSAVLDQCGLELDRIEFRQSGRQRVVRVSVDGDGPEGTGPTLDEIAEATKEVSRALDDADITGDRPFTLEVSSRGVSRPLTEAKHFRRNIGRLVSLKIVDAEAGEVLGRIVTSSDDNVTLLVSESEQVFSLSDIALAVVQVELK